MQFSNVIKRGLVPRKDKVYDLGVLFNSRFTFSEHIYTICLSGCKSLRFVIKYCNFNNVLAIKALYLCRVNWNVAL